MFIDTHNVDNQITENEIESLRLWVTKNQALDFVEQAIAVCAAGRPACELCGNPIDQQGHICPRTNGHHKELEELGIIFCSFAVLTTFRALSLPTRTTSPAKPVNLRPDPYCNGGKPIFFLDYIAVAKLKKKMALEIIDGIVKGCKGSRCSILGGETAEMPGLYKNDDFDLAGFAVGIVEKKNLITGSNIKEGDEVFGLKSTGFHSNGFSLIRYILKKKKLAIKKKYQKKL